MNVPRETFSRSRRAAAVRPLKLPAEMMVALPRNEKTQHRFLVDPRNSQVTPGHFGGLMLETARRRILDGNDGNPLVELRARCRFESGDVRAVSVQPLFKAGDLFWVASSYGTLQRSVWTLEVTSVDVARLQDMGNQEARAEGCDPVNVPVTPREMFARLWDRRRRGGDYWHTNPWVWVVRVATHQANVRQVQGVA